MGTRGRKPKPTAIRKLEGKPGHRPLNNAEPQPQAADTRTPRGKLPAEGRELWRVLAPQLDAIGVLKATDLPALEMLCLHYAMVRRAWKLIDGEGLIDDVITAVEAKKQKHPAASIFRENSMAFKGYLTEFGLTPSSRVRLKAEPVAKDKSLAEILMEGAIADSGE